MVAVARVATRSLAFLLAFASIAACSCLMTVSDAGFPAVGTDGGSDAGPDNAGRDAGTDAGRDAGPDAGGGSDAGSQQCEVPPFPDAGSCDGTQVEFSIVGSLTLGFAIWVEDATAPNGGWRIRLPIDTLASAGGHSYRFTSGDTKSGTSPDCRLFGFVGIEVDGVRDAIKFDYNGYVQAAGDAGSIVYSAALIRPPSRCSTGNCLFANPSPITCPSGCPPPTGRRYAVIREPGMPQYPKPRWRLVAEDPPRTCGTGVDLIGMSF